MNYLNRFVLQPETVQRIYSFISIFRSLIIDKTIAQTLSLENVNEGRGIRKKNVRKYNCNKLNFIVWQNVRPKCGAFITRHPACFEFRELFAALRFHHATDGILKERHRS